MRCDEGKTPYGTEAEAKAVAHAIVFGKEKRNKPMPNLRAYECPFCSAWHLTSQPKIDPFAHWASGGNRDLARRLMRRAAETPLFDSLVRSHNLRGKAFR